VSGKISDAFLEQREARATEQEHQQKIQALKSSQAADERAKKTTTDQIVGLPGYPSTPFEY
jgi:hypothetical protein